MMNRAVLFRDRDASEPLGESLGHVLLPEAFRAGAGRIPLHGDRPIQDVWQERGCDRFVIAGQLALRDAVLRKQHLLRMSNHGASRTTSRAGLSKRTPSRRG